MFARGPQRKLSASEMFGRFAKRNFATAGKDYVKVLDQHFSPAVPRSPKGNNIVVDHAKGCWITEFGTGRKYLDLQTGIGVANTGHCHPKVVAAVQDQVAKGIHLQQNCTISRPVVELLEVLNENTPKELTKFFFNCTGTEANESAVKLARHETGRQHIITFKGGFHGRSLTTLAMTSSKNVYGVGFGPYPSGFYQAPFCYKTHCDRAKCTPGLPADQCCGGSVAAIKELLKESISPNDTAAVIIEPILGEGGYVPPAKGFFTALRQLCDETGMLLISDEVQSGIGRTGKMWGIEHENVVPDVIIFAKGIASGMPLSGIAAKTEFMKKSPPGSMGGTYGCNAVSAAAAVATLNAIKEENMLANATARGDQLQNGLKALQKKYPQHILEVRGRGCMVGLEFNHPPSSGFAGHVTAKCMDHGLLLLTAGWRETIRFIPPLVISEQEMATAIDMFTKGFEDAIKTWSGAPLSK